MIPTEKQLRLELQEEMGCSYGSTQIIKFAFGVKYAMMGYEIPDDLYPIPTTKYLGTKYQGTNVPTWMIMLWSTTAMIQLQQQDLNEFGCYFDTWFSEKKLHRSMESLASCCFVINGVCTGDNRCTQCGQILPGPNVICYPCWKIQAPLTGLKVEQLEEWMKKKNLTVAFTSIWDDYVLN